jgi:cobyrinic acid a,c-diamide synthase
MAVPRILIAALRGGSGKTIISLGLIASLRKRGTTIAPFKKGPDFIDAGWLALAAGRPCHNLDAFLMPARQIHLSFTTHTLQADLAVIEGNRGLYDGMDLEGTTSTSELAKLLKLPVALIIDCTKTTRTVAAMVLGCVRFDPDVTICGVILNRLAGPRHESIVRQAVERECGLPVLGAIPKIKGEAFPERHMGLVPTPEHDWAEESIGQAAQMADKYLDLAVISRLAQEAANLPDSPSSPPSLGAAGGGHALSPRIGVIRDAAFQFYYPENLEALEAAGGKIVRLNALSDARLGNVDGLYIGGGFPETQAQALSANKAFREEVRLLAEKGLPIYAECGGLMYLGERLVLNGVSYPMVGILPVTFGFSKRPQGHGYTIFEVKRSNPFFKTGTQVRGHEFHYSKVLEWQWESNDLAFRMVRGQGFDGTGDGLCYKNTLATYSHLHALGTPSWAEAVVEAAAIFREKRLKA